MIPESSASPSTDGIQDWITAARGGDRDALGQAIQACRRYLLTAAEHDLTPDLRAKEGASDLVQETLCEAHRDFQRFDGQTEVELRAWLRRLLAFQVSNAVRRYGGTKMRKLRREVPIDTAGCGGQCLVDDQSSPSSLAVHHEEEAALRAALDRLPGRMAPGRALEAPGGLHLRGAGPATRLFQRRRPQALAACVAATAT